MGVDNKRTDPYFQHAERSAVFAAVVRHTDQQDPGEKVLPSAGAFHSCKQ